MALAAEEINPEDLKKATGRFRSALLWLFGVLLVFMLLVAAVGALLPKNHAAAAEITLNQPPDAVWQALTNHAADPSWRANVTKVEKLDDANGHAIWRETYSNGQALTMEDSLVCPAQHKLVRTIADKDLPFGGSWSYQVSPSGSGSQLHMEELGEVRNPIFRFVSRFVTGHHATLNEYQRYLAQKFGEPAHIVNPPIDTSAPSNLLSACR
jgi:hypothetical protein